MSSLARVETKVWAGLAGVVTGGAFGSFLVWLLGVTVWHVSYLGAHADEAIAAVPWPVAAIVPLGLSALFGGAAAYQAPPSNHAGNNAIGEPMDDSGAGHDPIDPVAVDADTADADAPAADVQLDA